MKNSSLSTEYGLFLVSFQGVLNHFVFSGNSETLGNLIQSHGKYGINFISRFNQSKSKFEKLSKSDVKNLFSWDTHSIQELKKINFIK